MKFELTKLNQLNQLPAQSGVMLAHYAQKTLVYAATDLSKLKYRMRRRTEFRKQLTREKQTTIEVLLIDEKWLPNFEMVFHYSYNAPILKFGKWLRGWTPINEPIPPQYAELLTDEQKHTLVFLQLMWEQNYAPKS